MENGRIGKVIRVGSSLALVIPVQILRGLKIARGDKVVFGVYDENTIAIRRITTEELQKFKPQELVF